MSPRSSLDGLVSVLDLVLHCRTGTPGQNELNFISFSSFFRGKGGGGIMDCTTFEQFHGFIINQKLPAKFDYVN